MYDENKEYKILSKDSKYGELTTVKAPKISEVVEIGDLGLITSNGTVYKEKSDQGFIFKSYINYQLIDLDKPCYVPELYNVVYTRKDILDMCGGNKKLAYFIFDVIDWQSPETFLDELKSNSGEYPEFFHEDGTIKSNEETIEAYNRTKYIDDKIYILTMEDYEDVLKENFDEKQINYIKDNFSIEQVRDVLVRKIDIDYEESIRAVIEYKLLANYKEKRGN